LPVIDETTPHKPDFRPRLEDPEGLTCSICKLGDDRYHPHNPVLVPLIAVDFDGTCCDMEFPLIGAPKKGVKEALTRFRELGYQIMIWSCRTSHFNYDVFGGDPRQSTMERDRVKDMIAWLNLHGIPYDEVDDGSRGKPGADFYIDDKGIRFDESQGNNWATITQFVESRTKGK
jgi:hypothetical protein